jgi:hypothetical protein
MRTNSPGKNPSSAKRRASSGGAAGSTALTDTTRATLPGGKSASPTSA